MPPAISVVCTFLNAADTLPATLESLHEQTATDVEIILIDDGSTDRSRAIAGCSRERDSRFRLYANPHPGRSRALNFGVAKSHSDYIAILDADDLAHPAWLEDALTTMRQSDEFVVLAFQRLIVRDLAKAIWEPLDETSDLSVTNITRDLARGNLIGHSGAVIRKSSLIEAGGYDENELIEDYDLWIRLAQMGDQLGLCDRVRVAKRYHKGQKFARRKGYDAAAWKQQLRAVMLIDRSYRNFLVLAWRILRDATRRPRQAVISLVRGQRSIATQ
jgi:glycosyltransferase involved in cell wall biosynthesis